MFYHLEEDSPPEGQNTGLFGGGETATIFPWVLESTNREADGGIISGHPVSPWLLETCKVGHLDLVTELLPGRRSSVEDYAVLSHRPTRAVVREGEVLIQGLGTPVAEVLVEKTLC